MQFAAKVLFVMVIGNIALPRFFCLWSSNWGKCFSFSSGVFKGFRLRFGFDKSCKSFSFSDSFFVDVFSIADVQVDAIEGRAIRVKLNFTWMGGERSMLLAKLLLLWYVFILLTNLVESMENWLLCFGL